MSMCTQYLESTIKLMVLVLQSDWMSHVQSCLQLQTPKISNSYVKKKQLFIVSIKNWSKLTFVLVVVVSSKIWDTCLIYFSLTFSLLAAIPIQFPCEQQPSLLDHFAFPCESEQLSSPSLWRVCVNDVSRM